MKAFRCDVCRNYFKEEAPYEVSFKYTTNDGYFSIVSIDVCEKCAKDEMEVIALILDDFKEE